MHGTLNPPRDLTLGMPLEYVPMQLCTGGIFRACVLVDFSREASITSLLTKDLGT